MFYFLPRFCAILVVVAMPCAILGIYYLNFGFNPLQAVWWIWLRDVIFSPVPKPLFIILPPILIGITGIILLVSIFLIFARSGSKTLSGSRKAGELHGTAAWAKWRDLKQAELHKNKGVVIGGFQRFFRTRTLTHDGAEHVLAFAPTRTGKGVSLIVPTLLKWSGSVFILDIKGENYALTSGYRASIGHRVIRFDPTSPNNQFSFNPLEEVAFGHDQEISEVQNLAAMIVDVDGAKAGGKDSFWTQSAAEFLTAGILYTIYRVRREHDRTANFADVRSYLAGSDEINFDDDEAAKQALNQMFRHMIEFDHGRAVVDNEVKLLATKMYGMAHVTRTGVIANAMHALSIFADPYIAKNLSHSDFKIRDLMDGDQAISLYLVVSPKDIDRMKPIVRIFVTQMLASLMSEMQFEDGKKKEDKRKLLLLMDEFPAFGKMDKYQEMLGYMAGYGIKSFIIVQDIIQLEAIYGEKQSFFSASSVRIAFAPNEYKTAKLISDMLGTGTIIQKKRSRSGEQGKLIGNMSENLHETSRALLTPDEVMRIKLMEKGWFGRIKPGDSLIFIASRPPIFGKQKLFFQDKKLLAYTQIPPFDPKAHF